MLPLVLLLFFGLAFAQGIFVVERERQAVAVIEGDNIFHIKDVGNTNHATVKFFRSKAYLISRDGFLTEIDPLSKKVTKKVKVGKSSIGFTFCSDKIAVANYSPKDVVFLDRKLKELKRIKTDSRNVGIKSYKEKLIFSLMDKDQIWVMDCSSLEVVKRFKDIGDMPFDALIHKGKYIAGLFREKALVIVDLENLSYRKVTFTSEDKAVVFKIPHFGMWGVWGSTAYIPAVGERKVLVVDLDRFAVVKEVTLIGHPVFVSVSPDGRFLAVNYSGDKEDFVTLIDREKLKVVKDAKLGRRILHLRFSPDGKTLFVSSYYENLVKEVSLPEMEVLRTWRVPTPSGIFVEGGKSHG